MSATGTAARVDGRCNVPQSKKKTPTTKKGARSSRASWSEGERRIDRQAAKAGIKPIGDLADLAHLTPEEGEELLSAIREMKEIDRRAVCEKEKRKRGKRA
jgi:hypothetical protein